MSINIRHDTNDISTSTITKPSIGGVAFNSMVPLAGHFTNGSMSVTTAITTATFTADEVVLKTALGGDTYILHGYSQAINLAATGAGGMDTGTAPASGYVALYAIYNPTTATANILATNATAAAAPTIYGGANMPAGYTASALISVWPTNASSQFVIGQQSNRVIDLLDVNVLSTTSVLTNASLSLSSAVPKNAKMCKGRVDGSPGTAAARVSVYLYSTSAGAGTVGVSSNVTNAGGIILASFSNAMIVTAQTLYVTTAVGSGSATYNVFISGYSF